MKTKQKKTNATVGGGVPNVSEAAKYEELYNLAQKPTLSTVVLARRRTTPRSRSTTNNIVKKTKRDKARLIG